MITKNGYEIDKSLVKKKHYAELKVEPIAMKEYKFVDNSFLVYRTIGNKVVVPKYYGIATFGPPSLLLSSITTPSTPSNPSTPSVLSVPIASAPPHALQALSTSPINPTIPSRAVKSNALTSVSVPETIGKKESTTSVAKEAITKGIAEEIRVPEGPRDMKERIGLDIVCPFVGDLRPHQAKYCKTLLDHIDKFNSCIACAVPGYGKTALSLYVCSNIKKKTLIVVHKQFLMDQWILRIEQFLPNARVGIIRQDKLEIENKDIVIAMLQTIVCRDFVDTTFDTFGLTIFDECHHICSNSFSKSLFKIATRKSLGLSATPKRKDGLTKVLNWFLGEIVNSDAIASATEIPIARIVMARYDKISPPVPKMNFAGKLNSQDLINQLVTDKVRNQQIVDEIVKEANNGRKILLLSDRREHCVSLSVTLSEMTDKDGKKFAVGLYLGGMTEEQLSIANKKNIIFATFSMAQEGYDNPVLDTLILATGKTDIEQAVGRIMRQRNENTPLVIDMTDSFLPSQTRIRRTYFREHKFVIEEVAHVATKDSTFSQLFTRTATVATPITPIPATNPLVITPVHAHIPTTRSPFIRTIPIQSSVPISSSVETSAAVLALLTTQLSTPTIISTVPIPRKIKKKATSTVVRPISPIITPVSFPFIRK